MQIKCGFKKEWLQFWRTFRFGGLILGIFSFALADPLMYKVLAVMMESLGDMDFTAITAEASIGGDVGGYNAIDEMSGMINDAGLIFAVTMSEFCATSMLITMLILMSPSGGEQKKRATIIPSCCGLDYFSYLVPKFVLYPLTVFALGFVSSLCAGGLCNALFDANQVGIGLVLLASFMCGVYMAFITAVYMSIGLCTSRPGLVTVMVYIGSTLAELILTSLELTKFHPFTLRALISGEMFAEDFSLADNAASIAVGVLLSVVISVVMFFLALAVLKAKKINNQEDKPEF